MASAREVRETVLKWVDEWCRGLGEAVDWGAGRAFFFILNVTVGMGEHVQTGRCDCCDC